MPLIFESGIIHNDERPKIQWLSTDAENRDPPKPKIDDCLQIPKIEILRNKDPQEVLLMKLNIGAQWSRDWWLVSQGWFFPAPWSQVDQLPCIVCSSGNLCTNDPKN